MPYAVIITSKEVLVDEDYVITQAGERFWIVEEDSWAWARGSQDPAPKDLWTFETQDDAHRFMAEEVFYPWWVQANTYEVVEVEPIYEPKVIGWRQL
jgi:hypothetical protein